MQNRRVVITGLGAISPLGNSVSAFTSGLKDGRSAVVRMDEWSVYKGLRSLVAAPAKLENEKLIPRQSRRSMGKMSIFSVQAAQEALTDCGLNKDVLNSGRLGCIIGSSMGSAKSINDVFELMLPNKDLSLLTSMQFFQCVSHTATLNVAQHFGINGVVMATSAACASGLQAVGAAYDLIRMGRQDVVLAGGCEELHPTVTGTFDVLFATSSKYNDSPTMTPRPFDKDRDGLVCGEGSGILVVEDYEHAKTRNAKIYAEIIGYNTASSGLHVSQSSKDALGSCIKEAIKEAGINPKQIDYINAHATATLQGDVEESQAVADIFGDTVPISSLKGYIGHTLGASGALELIAGLNMMQEGLIYPTLNLNEPSPDCQGVMHVKKLLKKDINIMLKNCFALGGINAAMVLRKV